MAYWLATHLHIIHLPTYPFKYHHPKSSQAPPCLPIHSHTIHLIIHSGSHSSAKSTEGPLIHPLIQVCHTHPWTIFPLIPFHSCPTCSPLQSIILLFTQVVLPQADPNGPLDSFIFTEVLSFQQGLRAPTWVYCSGIESLQSSDLVSVPAVRCVRSPCSCI